MSAGAGLIHDRQIEIIFRISVMMRGSQQMMACEQSDYLASHISISFLFHIQIKQEYDYIARPDGLKLYSGKANFGNLFLQSHSHKYLEVKY